MTHPDDDDHEDIVVDPFCTGCDLPLPVNDLGFCDDCFAKLERDLIRARDWEYSITAFGLSPDQCEALRNRVIQEYGLDNELLEVSSAPQKPKNKRSRSRAAQRKREIAARAIRDYNTEDVLQAAQEFIQQQKTEWVNFSRVAQHLYETFHKLKPKHLGSADKKYTSLLQFLVDYPAEFETRPDPDKKGLYWIRRV